MPASSVIPKELLPLGELPLIHHALLEVEQAGFDEAIIVISPRKRGLRAYFDADVTLEHELTRRGTVDAVDRMHAARGLAERLNLRFIEKETKGPGEAALLANRLTGDEVFGLLLPDDVVTTSDHWHALRHVHQLDGAAALCVRRMRPEDSSRYGVALLRREGQRLRVAGLVEKPAPGTYLSQHRVFGRYIVTRPVLAALDERLGTTRYELQLTDGFAECTDLAPGVSAVEFRRQFYECGTPSEYALSAARYARDIAGRAPLRVLERESV